MIFKETGLGGLYLIEPELIEDGRGHFARVFCAREFSKMGLNPAVAQRSVSYNKSAGTLRGMHYQRAPHGEDKLVACASGAIYDVAVDVRMDSPTFGQWRAFGLSAENGHSLYIPAGFAHGFQTLADNSVVTYQMAQFYAPEHSAGFRWDDPDVDIQWPVAVQRIISAKDGAWPLLKEAAH
ncbi:MAG: dTDP-4-dehydrorhamnose 3,5-epimerase [Nitrospinae bacterium]|nr:dTDP-4-dehydrorhamnose 3,5-epimerase [Nitrospinota bacterium]